MGTFDLVCSIGNFAWGQISVFWSEERFDKFPTECDDICTISPKLIIIMNVIACEQSEEVWKPQGNKYHLAVLIWCPKVAS